MRNYLVKFEQDAIERNRGKKIKFTDGLGDEAEGYIQGGRIIHGSFVYEVSASKNPKTEFNFQGRGKWYGVAPVTIHHLPDSNTHFKRIIIMTRVTYKQISKRAYTTQTTGIEFEVKINGKTAKGWWTPYFQYVSGGVDVNELKIGEYEYIDIFSGGSGHRMYEISSSLGESEKQPKKPSIHWAILGCQTIEGCFCR